MAVEKRTSRRATRKDRERVAFPTKRRWLGSLSHRNLPRHQRRNKPCTIRVHEAASATSTQTTNQAGGHCMKAFLPIGARQKRNQTQTTKKQGSLCPGPILGRSKLGRAHISCNFPRLFPHRRLCHRLHVLLRLPRQEILREAAATVIRRQWCSQYAARTVMMRSRYSSSPPSSSKHPWFSQTHSRQSACSIKRESWDTRTTPP